MSFLDKVSEYSGKLSSTFKLWGEPKEEEKDMSAETYTEPATNYTVPLVIVGIGALAFVILRRKK